MKKALTMILIFGLCFIGFVYGQEQSEEQKEDPLKNLNVIDKVQPAPDKVKAGFESITGKDAVTHLKFIASDLLEGRDTGSRGYDIAALYAATMFELWGIKPAGDFVRPVSRSRFAPTAASVSLKRGYFQGVPLKEILSNESKIKVDWQKGALKKSRTFASNVDFTYSGSGTQSFAAPVVFVGYGIQEKSLKLDEYKGFDVKGKIVMMLSETPGKDDPESPFNKGELIEKYYPQRRMMRRMTSPKTKLAKDLGAIAILMVENSPHKNPDVAQRSISSQKINDERPIYPGNRRRMSLIQGKRPPMPWETLPTVRISREMADIILGYVGQDVETLKGKIEKTLQSQSMVLAGVNMAVANKAETKLVDTANVLGYIEGSDPELKDEVIVIGAHLDHLGKRGDYIFNGADDNGSGSVGVMEIAEAFAKNSVKPKRSVLFALWTGEEKGLYGSFYYTANPFFPLKKTVANLNLDMISRVNTLDRIRMMARMFGIEADSEVFKKIDVKKFLSLSYDANTEILGDLLRANNQYVGLALYLRPSETASGGSDHAPFAMKKVPWAAFMAAMTDDYHQSSDSVDKVNAAIMQKIIRLVYLTAFDLADK